MGSSDLLKYLLWRFLSVRHYRGGRYVETKSSQYGSLYHLLRSLVGMYYQLT